MENGLPPEIEEIVMARRNILDQPLMQGRDRKYNLATATLIGHFLQTAYPKIQFCVEDSRNPEDIFVNVYDPLQMVHFEEAPSINTERTSKGIEYTNILALRGNIEGTPTELNARIPDTVLSPSVEALIKAVEGDLEERGIQRQIYRF